MQCLRCNPSSGIQRNGIQPLHQPNPQCCAWELPPLFPLGFWRWSGPCSARLPASWPSRTRTSLTASLSSTGYGSLWSQHQDGGSLQGWEYQLLHLRLKIFGKIFLFQKENKLRQEKGLGCFFLHLLIGRFLPLQSAALPLCPGWKVTALESCQFSRSSAGAGWEFCCSED